MGSGGNLTAPLPVYHRGDDLSLPGEVQSLFTKVLTAIEGKYVPEWRRSLILKLAESVDANPRAATVRELQLLLNDVERSAPSTDDKTDNLQTRRQQRRRAGAGGASPPDLSDRRGGQ